MAVNGLSVSSRDTPAPGCTPTYDANGNTTYDCLHTYTWDANGHPVTIDDISLTYDALGRMVEKTASGATNQFLYGPGGSKLALMNGQTVVKGFIGNAIYSGGTLSYFRHVDWLGSVRLGSNTNRQMQFSLGYGPFGEGYAEAGGPDRSFAGMDQDTEVGSTSALYDAVFRRYAMYGRWISPDPAGVGAVSLASPQSWNRYAYVMNNPLNVVDPLGLGCERGEEPCGDDQPGVICEGSGCYFNNHSYNCGIDGTPAPCWLADLSLRTGAAFPTSFNGKPCYQAENGNVFCGWNEADREPFDPMMLSGTPGFPISAQCAEALGSRTGGFRRAQNNWSAIRNAADANGIDPRVLAAIGVRETDFQNITGDYGHGHGVFQLDDRWNPAAVIQIAYNIPQAATFAASKIAASTNAYLNRGYSYDSALAGAVRNYNGTGGAPTPTLLNTGYAPYLDIGTTNGNYVTDVLAIAANCF